MYLLYSCTHVNRFERGSKNKPFLFWNSGPTVQAASTQESTDAPSLFIIIL